MNVSRHILPGGEWLYYKLYTQPNNADTILLALSPTIRRLKECGMVDLFFFIRYNDPSFHLRLRFRCPEQGSVASVLTNEFNALFDKKLIYNVTIDTYHREIERYGGDSILEAEQIFGIDSLHILVMLGLLDKKNSLDTEERWLYALSLIDNTLDGFGLSVDKKLAFIKVMSKSFKSEFGFDSHRFVCQIDDKYRSNSEIIRRYLAKDIDPDLVGLLESRLGHIKRVFDGAENKREPLAHSIGSLIHMSMNRWFKTQGRLYELFLYSFLVKYYTTEMMKERNGARH
jgi:hypothetical protein